MIGQVVCWSAFRIIEETNLKWKNVKISRQMWQNFHLTLKSLIPIFSLRKFYMLISLKSLIQEGKSSFLYIFSSLVVRQHISVEFECLVVMRNCNLRRENDRSLIL